MSILKKVLKAASPTLLAAIFSVSCSLINRDPIPSNPDNPDQPGSDFSETTTMRGLDYESPTDTIKMHSNALFLRDDINQHLVSYNENNAVITFENCEAVKDAQIKVGDVLYSEIIEGKAPNGYLLTVKEILNTDDQIVFKCSDADLSDAFDRLHIPIIYELDKISADDFTVFDIFNQPDLSEDFNTSGWQYPTKADVPWVDFSKDFAKLKNDRYKITPTWEGTTIEAVILDLDEDLKNTKNDQLVLSLFIQHDLGLAKDDIFDYGSMPYLWVSVESKARFGVTATFSIGKETEFDAEGGKYDELTEEMEKKILGKKLLVAKWDIPVPPSVATVLKPSMEFYLTAKIGLSGKIEFTYGFENYGFDYKIGNKPIRYDGGGFSGGSSFQDVSESTYFRKGNEGKPVLKFKLEGDLKGSVGAGVGLTFGLPKIVNVLMKSNTPPYIGLFYEYSKVLDLKASIDLGESITFKGEHYNQTEGRCEAYVQFKNDWLWNPKFTIDVLENKWPDPPEFLDTTFILQANRPKPYLVYPENGSVVRDPEIMLEWTICTKLLSNSDKRHYQNLTYDVYVSTDKSLVQQCNVRCRIVTGLEDNKDGRKCSFEPNFSGKYYWRVVTHNSLGEDFMSSIYSFDTDSGGTLVLNPELTAYLKMNRDILEGIDVNTDGTIELTISNQKALREMRTLTITDKQGLYGIKSIDDLLVHLPSLESLECMNNKITSLNLTKNPKVKFMDCSYNEIEQLSFADNNSMETLVCKSNKLLALDIIKDLPNLTTLSCSDNDRLYTLNKSGNRTESKLETLTASCCALSVNDNDFTLTPHLKTLFVNDNDLWAIDISKCKDLVRVDLSGQSTTQMRVYITRAIKAQLIDPKFHFDTLFVFDDPGGEGNVGGVPGENL